MNFITYHLGSRQGKELIQRAEIKEPESNAIVTIRGRKYRILNYSYDYELWQFIGEKWYDVIVEEYK